MSDRTQTRPPLPEGELSEILKRAHEISDQTRLIVEPGSDIARYVEAAEEAGIPRDATIQALRERLDIPLHAFHEGDFVFARSQDGHFYAAKLLQVEGREASVRFLSGSDHRCDTTDLMLFSLTPGQKIGVQSSHFSMWVDGVLERYNRDANSVTVEYWGTTETVPLEKIRVPRKQSQSEMTLQAKLWAVGIASALGGGVVGAILMRLLTR